MRTDFSSQQWLYDIRTLDANTISELLSYFMWETSTDTMCRVGLPTDDDVREWVIVLSNRVDSTIPSIQLTITDCLDYIHGTRNALQLFTDQHK